MSTVEQLSEIVERVRAATVHLGGDDFHLRRIAFEKLLEHELRGLAQPRGSTALDRQSSEAEEPFDKSFATPAMRVEAVAGYFGMDPGLVEEIFDLSGKEPRLVLAADKLAADNGDAVRQIALLVSTARTALGIETGSAHLLAAAESYDRADRDFMRHLTTFDRIVVWGRLSSTNRRVRIRAIGMEAAIDLAQRLVSN